MRRNLDVMNELLVENDPGKESADDLQLMKELHQTTESMQERVTGLIGRVTDEIVLGKWCIVVLGRSTGCVSLTTRGSGGTAHTCSGRHSQYSCELLAWVPGVALHSL